MDNQTIKQEHYPELEFDFSEKDIVQIFQKGEEDFNIIHIEREKLKEFISLLPVEQLTDDFLDGIIDTVQFACKESEGYAYARRKLKEALSRLRQPLPLQVEKLEREFKYVGDEKISGHTALKIIKDTLSSSESIVDGIKKGLALSVKADKEVGNG